MPPGNACSSSSRGAIPKVNCTQGQTTPNEATYYYKVASPAEAPPPPQKKAKEASASASAFPGFHPLAPELDRVPATDPTNDDDCGICTFALKDPGMYDEDSAGAVRHWGVLRVCGHHFHETCLSAGLLAQSQDFVQCPQCKRVYGKKMGTQPRALQMTHRVCRGQTVPGFAGSPKAIEITYSCPPGVQGPEHPHPGR